MFALTLPYRLQNFCSAIRATLGQRQILQSPGLALNAHSGNDWGPIPVLTGAWWLIHRVDTCRPMGRGLESRRHVGSLGKSFIRSCLWRVGVKLRFCYKSLVMHKICPISIEATEIQNQPKLNYGVPGYASPR